MTAQTQPDAYKGGTAMNTITKFMLLALAAMGAGLLGGLGLVIGGIGYLGGGGAIALAPGATLAGAAVAAFGVSMAGIKVTARRNAPHIEAWTKQVERAKQQQKSQAAAAPETGLTILPENAAEAFNPQAAVKLDNDVRTMRPLKFNARQQQQAQP
jgi:hypothetical protein